MIIPVYMSCDDAYVAHLSIAIKSVILNTKSDLHFVILISSLTEGNKELIRKVCSPHLVDFVEIGAFKEKIDNFKYKCEHISLAACYRYFIPLLDFAYDKAIYIDCDIIVRGDISELFDIDLGGNYLGAVDDFVKSSYYKKFGLSRYFNSGVLLLNIGKMREDDIASKFVQKTIELQSSIKYLDQDVMNVVCAGKVLFLPAKWGALSTLYRKNVRSQFVGENDVRNAVYNPQIVHFTGPDKPWKIPYGIIAHPWTPAYFYYARYTPFNDFVNKIIADFCPLRRFFWYWKRHLLFFLHPQFFKMRRLYSKNKKIYKI